VADAPQAGGMRGWPWRSIAMGLAVGVGLYLASGGRLIFFLLPLGLGLGGWFGRGRAR